jgi:hypothetical protein
VALAVPIRGADVSAWSLASNDLGFAPRISISFLPGSNCDQRYENASMSMTPERESPVVSVYRDLISSDRDLVMWNVS